VTSRVRLLRGDSSARTTPSGDFLGRLNLITPEVVTEAVGVVRRDLSFRLDLSISEFHPTARQHPGRVRHRVLRAGHDGIEDLNDFFSQISSQWDSLAQSAATPNVFVNGRSVEDVAVRGRNAIDHWARKAVVTRGVLLDLPIAR
jgi:hypothetical protein